MQAVQIGGAHMCACAPKCGRAMCMRAAQKRVATHTLKNMSEDIDVDLFSYERSFL